MKWGTHLEAWVVHAHNWNLLECLFGYWVLAPPTNVVVSSQNYSFSKQLWYHVMVAAPFSQKTIRHLRKEVTVNWLWEEWIKCLELGAMFRDVIKILASCPVCTLLKIFMLGPVTIQEHSTGKEFPWKWEGLRKGVEVEEGGEEVEGGGRGWKQGGGRSGNWGGRGRELRWSSYVTYRLSFFYLFIYLFIFFT